MCHDSCIDFGKSALTADVITNKNVVEVGSANHNGTLKQYVQEYNPKTYLGIDIQSAPGVDQICKAEEMTATFGANRFDLIVCTEVMEHVQDWKLAIKNFKNVLVGGGKIMITTRSKGFAYHGSPYDFWRYEIADMQAIFSDFTIDKLIADPTEPGIFLLATKPADFKENDLSSYRLYSIMKRRNIIDSASVVPTRFDIQLNKSVTKVRTEVGAFLPRAFKSYVKKLMYG